MLPIIHFLVMQDTCFLNGISNNCNQSIWEVQNRPHTFKLALPQLSNQYHNNECQDTCNDGQCYSGDLVCVLQNDNKGKMKVDDKNIVKQNKMWVT